MAITGILVAVGTELEGLVFLRLEGVVPLAATGHGTRALRIFFFVVVAHRGRYDCIPRAVACA